jgi:Caspase domain
VPICVACMHTIMMCRWLVGGAQDDDSLFFHYSGHGGSQKGVSDIRYTDCMQYCLYHHVTMFLHTLALLASTCLLCLCRSAAVMIDVAAVAYHII